MCLFELLSPCHNACSAPGVGVGAGPWPSTLRFEFYSGREFRFKANNLFDLMDGDIATMVIVAPIEADFPLPGTRLPQFLPRVPASPFKCLAVGSMNKRRHFPAQPAAADLRSCIHPRVHDTLFQQKLFSVSRASSQSKHERLLTMPLPLPLLSYRPIRPMSIESLVPRAGRTLEHHDTPSPAEVW